MWLSEEDCRLDDFVALVEHTTDHRQVPFADSIVENVPVYDCNALRRHLDTAAGRRAVQAELVHVLLHGPASAVVRRTAGRADATPIDIAPEPARRRSRRSNGCQRRRLHRGAVPE